MPRRDDIRSILILGSGPIVIGQACEFDYSGTQACRALRARGVPGDPGQLQPGDHHDRPGVRRRHLRRAADARGGGVDPRRERPDAILPTVGGQTGINLAIALDERGALERYGVELLGAERRGAASWARTACCSSRRWRRSGSRCRKSGYAGSLEEARAIVGELGYPLIVRPSFTLGGEGGGVRLQPRRARRGGGASRSQASPVHQRAARAVGPGLEGVRARGDARPPGQRHRRLLGRERRRHGRPHRRLDHGGAAADALRPRVPGDARRRLQGDPPRRRRHRRLQHPVRASTPRPASAW